MKLRDRIGMNQKTPVVATNSTSPARPAPNGRQATVDRSYMELKLRVHRDLLISEYRALRERIALSRTRRSGPSEPVTH